MRLSARRARGAQGGPRDHRRLAAVSVRTTTLARPLNCQACRPAPQIGVDPRTGQADDQGHPNDRLGANHATAARRDRMTPRAARRRSAVPRSPRRGEPRERVVLSDRSRAAWRCSTTPIDRRQDVPGPPPTDRPARGRSARMLRGRIDSLRTLAEATDGLAIVDSNDLAARLQARRRRPELVLPARLLLDRQARRKVPLDFGPREAAGRAGARAPRVTWRRRRRDAPRLRRAPRRRRPRPAPSRRIRDAARRRSGDRARWPATRATSRCVCRWRSGWKPGDSASAAMWIVGELGGVADAGRRLERWLRRHRHADDAGDATRRDRTHDGARAARVTFRIARHAVSAAWCRASTSCASARGPARRRSRRARRRGCRVPAAPEAVGALFVRRGRVDGQQGRADRRPAIPPERTDPRRDSDGVERAGDGAASRPHGQATRGPGDRGRARRRRRLALGHGAARARAAGAGGLRRSRLRSAISG